MESMKRTLLYVCRFPLTWFLLACKGWSYELSPPQDVRLDSVLQWRPATGPSHQVRCVQMDSVLRWRPELPHHVECVHLDSVLRWSPATEPPHRVKYTAQYLVFGGVWENVPGCVQTELTSCNISMLVLKERPCVMLRVQTMEGSHSSRPLQAYSHDQACSPVFTLTPLPGSLTVHMWNNSLSYEYGDHGLYLINYSRNSQMQEQFTGVKSSKIIKDLEVGDRVCVEVQYSLYRKPYGPPSKQQCVDIPVLEKDIQIKTVMIWVVVLVLAALVLLAIAYYIIKKYEKLKQLLRPPFRLPDHFEEFLSQPFQTQPPPQTQTTQSEESYDHISFILPTDDELSGV